MPISGRIGKSTRSWFNAARDAATDYGHPAMNQMRGQMGRVSANKGVRRAAYGIGAFGRRTPLADLSGLDSTTAAAARQGYANMMVKRGFKRAAIGGGVGVGGMTAFHFMRRPSSGVYGVPNQDPYGGMDTYGGYY